MRSRCMNLSWVVVHRVWKSRMLRGVVHIAWSSDQKEATVLVNDSFLYKLTANNFP